MKKIIFAFCLLLAGLSSKAQYNYSEWGIGGGYNLIRPYSDLKQNDNSQSFNVNAYYNYSPYLPFSLEVQAGKLSGGNALTDPSHRYFKSNFLCVSLHGDLQLGEIIDYDNSFFNQAVKNFYIGTGIGVMHNKMTDIRRDDIDDIGHVFPGKNQSSNLFIPIRFGVEFKIYDWEDVPFMGITLGYVHNITFGEGMDGYDDPPSKFKNNAPDMFRQISIGVKFNFGSPVAYIKSIK